MIRTSENRPRTVHQSRVLGAFLAALLGLLSRNLLAQEGRSFTDLLIAERGTTFLLFNRGDGTFIVEDYMLDDADGAAVGDFDGDGDVDIAILTGLLLGHGDFSFILVNFAREDVELCRYTDNFLEFADMDADGLMDIVLGCLDTVVIYYGTGDERIIERGTVLLSGATYRESKEGPTILAVGDMNEDGLPDLSMGQTAFGTQFFLNQGGRSYKPLSDELPLGHLLTSHDGLERWIDFNGDGHLDIISPYGVFLGDGKLGFTKVEYPKDVGPINRPEIVDIDGDRELDIVSLGASFWPVEGPDTLKAAAISILGRGDGTFREVRRSTSLPSSLEVPDSRWPIVVRFYDFTTGDFNGDGAVDMALVIGRNSQFEGYICEGVLWILDGIGGGSFAEPRIYPGPCDAWRVFNLGNVDRQFVRGDASDDGRLDIADAVVILLALFSGRGVNCGQALDANDDRYIDVTDAVFLLEYLFLAGPPPPAPYPQPGIDATDPFFNDDLGMSYPGCSPEWWEVFRKRRAAGGG